MGIESISVSNHVRVLDFKTSTGRLYAVEYSPTLAASNSWLVLTNNLPGTGSRISVPDSGSATTRFYRLKAQPSP